MAKKKKPPVVRGSPDPVVRGSPDPAPVVRGSPDPAQRSDRRSNKTKRRPAVAEVRGQETLAQQPETLAQQEDTKPEKLIVATRSELSRELKRRIGKGSVRTLADWFKEGCPNSPGAYDVDAIEHWVLENVGAEGVFEEVNELAADRAHWTVMKIREQALKAQAERLML